MARVLRDKYFHDNCFLIAKAKPNISIVWKSIMWGKSLFDKGYRWKVCMVDE